jgi:DNA-binding NarL/FixJ family response regulator
MIYPVFCLICGGKSCQHLQDRFRHTKNRVAGERAVALTAREIDVIRAVVDPQFSGLKQIAYALHIEHSSLKFYLSRMYRKLGWYSGNLRLLTLWAIAHRGEIEIRVPTPEQFQRPAACGRSCGAVQ